MSSTIAALESHGIEATQALNYYNYAMSDTIPVPKTNRQVDVNVNVDTYTAADKLLPTIINVTVGLQVNDIAVHFALSVSLGQSQSQSWLPYMALFRGPGPSHR